MSAPNRSFVLPESIARKLRSVQRRMTSVGVATAFVVALAVLLSAMTVSMLVDYLATLYDSAWRGVLTTAALGMSLATLAGWAVFAWRRSSRVAHVAQEVDRRVPSLEERWSTVAHFAERSESSGAAEGEVHPAMYRQVVDEAAQGEKYVDAEDVVSLSGVVKAFLAVNAITLVLVLAAVADWRQTSVLMRRFWAPSANISATTIAAEPGNAVVGRGEPLLVTASFEGAAVDEATLYLRRDEGSDRVTLIPRGEATLGVTHRIRSVEQSFAYRLRSGDGQTDWYDVTVADRPAIGAVRISISPPEYRHEKTKQIKKMPRQISAVEGSQFAFELKPKAELKSLTLRTGDGESAELTPDHDGWYRWETELTGSLTLTPVLTEPHGLTLRRPPTTRVHVYPDLPPVVRITSPDDHIAVAPNDTIEIEFVAEDDNGIGAAELVVSQDPLDPDADPIELETIPIDLADDYGKKRVRGKTQLDLSQYPLVDGSGLSYTIRVAESRSPNQAAGPRSSRPPPAGGDPSSDAIAASAAAAQSPEDSDQSPTADAEAQADDAANENPQAAALAAAESAGGQDATEARGPSESALPDAGMIADASPGSRSGGQAMPDGAMDESGSPLADGQGEGTGSAGATGASSQGPASESQIADATTTDPTAAPVAGAVADSGETGEAPAGIAMADPSAEPAPDGAPDGASEEATAGETAVAASDVMPAAAAADLAASDDAVGDEAMPDDSLPGDPMPGEGALADGADDNADDNADDSADDGASGNRTAESRTRSVTAGSDTEDAMADEATSDAEMVADGSVPDPLDPNEADAQPNDDNAASLANVDEMTDEMNSEADAEEPPTGAVAATPDAMQPPDAGNRQPNPNGSGGTRSATASQTARAMATSSSGGNSSGDGPPNPMTQRMLDVGATGTSNAMRVEVDQYAGSFEGQQRAKLEMAIAPDLDAVQGYLVRAQKLSRSVLDDLAGQGDWQARHHRDVNAAEKSLKEAQQIVSKLQGRTRNTPYAFIGLQIADISSANLTPARDYFWRSLQAEGPDRVEKVRQGWQQVGQALDRLARLTQRFEGARREFALADASERVRKMYVAFIEDSFASPLRPAGEGGGSQFSREMAELELDEEYLERLREFLEKQRELRRELAMILSEDPRLLRRFMNTFRQGQQNLHDQLTELHARQEDLAVETKFWAQDDSSKRATGLTVIIRRRLQEMDELALDAGQMVERYEAWMPLREDSGGTAIKAGLDEANALAADARELAVYANRLAGTRVAPDQLAPLKQRSDALYERLKSFEVVLRGLGSSESGGGDVEFVVNRLAETRRLITGVSSWSRRIKELTTGQFQRVAAIEQYQLATDVDALAAELADVEADLAVALGSNGQVPASIANEARALLRALDEEVTPNQMAAAIAAEREQWPRATERQQAALEGLAEAGERFDELIRKSITELDKLPPNDPTEQDDPTLDQLLAQLEREQELETALGIPRRPNNLRVIDDWMRPGAGNNGGSGGNSGMFARMMRRRQQRLDRAAQRAQREALERIKQSQKVVRKAPPKREDAGESTDWNKLISELESELLQGRDKLPPEQYRSAIEQYRTILNQMTSGGGE